MNDKKRVLMRTLAATLILGVAPGAVAQSPHEGSGDFPEIITLTPADSRVFIASSVQKRPEIAAFIKSTIEGHPSMAAARAALQAEQAQARGKGRKLYNPELEVDLETAETETAIVGLSQTLDRHGKRKVRAAAGRDDVIAAQAALELVEKTLQSELLSALGAYQVDFDFVQMAQRKVEFSKEFLTLAQRRKAAGDLSTSEVLTAQLALSSSLADLARTQGEYSRARQALVTLSGTKRDVWPLLVGTPQGSYARNWIARPEDLPEIRLASAQSKAFRTRISVAQKMRKTDPTIGGRVGIEGSSALFGVSLAIPLQINNNFSDSVDVARAQSVQADAGLARVRRQTIARLNATRHRFEAAELAWQAWQETGASELDTQRSLLKRLWEAGEINAVDYLIQFNQTFDAESASAQLKAAYWLSWFERLDASNSIPQWLETLS